MTASLLCRHPQPSCFWRKMPAGGTEDGNMSRHYARIDRGDSAVGISRYIHELKTSVNFLDIEQGSESRDKLVGEVESCRLHLRR
jgi:hypothetical protein